MVSIKQERHEAHTMKKIESAVKSKLFILVMLLLPAAYSGTIVASSEKPWYGSGSDNFIATHLDMKWERFAKAAPACSGSMVMSGAVPTA